MAVRKLTMTKLVLGLLRQASGSNITKHVETCRNMSKYINTCQNASKHVKTHRNTSEHVKTRQNMSKYVKTHQNMLKHICLYCELFQLCPPYLATPVFQTDNVIILKPLVNTFVHKSIVYVLH